MDDPIVDPRFGKVGKQTVEDTGPADQKGMETIVRANRPLGRWFLVRSNYFRIDGTSRRMPDKPDQQTDRDRYLNHNHTLA